MHNVHLTYINILYFSYVIFYKFYNDTDSTMVIKKTSKEYVNFTAQWKTSRHTYIKVHKLQILFKVSNKNTFTFTLFTNIDDRTHSVNNKQIP